MPTTWSGHVAIDITFFVAPRLVDGGGSGGLRQPRVLPASSKLGSLSSMVRGGGGYGVSEVNGAEWLKAVGKLQVVQVHYISRGERGGSPCTVGDSILP